MLPTIATCRPLTENTCSVPLLRNAEIRASASGGVSPITTARITWASCESSGKPGGHPITKTMPDPRADGGQAPVSTRLADQPV